MKVSRAEAINDAAATWLNRVDFGEIKEDDPTLHEWLQSSPRHYFAYHRLKIAWDRASVLKTLATGANADTIGEESP